MDSHFTPRLNQKGHLIGVTSKLDECLQDCYLINSIIKGVKNVNINSLKTVFNETYQNIDN